ncbi:MAG TPA: PqqD family protein [Vicinamibacteria bacterium]|nr:PqqD family protein [Vicinamibacteria bacterium]
MPGPRRRRDSILVERLGDETLVYDLERHRAHSLNHTAGLVWSACNGDRDSAAIARHIASDVPGATADLVDVALARLARARLVTGGVIHRRAALRRLSLAAGLLPVVSSIVVPEPAQAATCSPAGGCCAEKADCCPDLNCIGPTLPQCASSRPRSCRPPGG